MFSIKHIRTTAATLLALLTLGIGGATIANAARSPAATPPATNVAAPVQPAPDPSGPNDKPDTAGDPSGPNDKADTASDPSGPNDKPDTAESASEIPNGDGPGGHADEVGAQR